MIRVRYINTIIHILPIINISVESGGELGGPKPEGRPTRKRYSFKPQRNQTEAGEEN